MVAYEPEHRYHTKLCMKYELIYLFIRFISTFAGAFVGMRNFYFLLIISFCGIH